MTDLTLAALALPLAHLGHWLWTFYVAPVLIVIGGIVLSTRTAKRHEAEDQRGEDHSGGG